MSQMRLPNGEVIDVFGAGGTAATARQYNLPFLGAVDLDPAIRQGGDRGLPVALGGPEDARAKAYFEIAREVISRSDDVLEDSKDVLEIS
jgi:ATP-binding protein involved in chromosome partitioning